MAHRFEIDPQGTASGLSTAGETRATAAASGIPALPMGNYVAGFSAAAAAVLATLSAELTGTVGSGLANTATTAASTETTEVANQASLTTWGTNL
jgi:hypothetical protein